MHGSAARRHRGAEAAQGVDRARHRRAHRRGEPPHHRAAGGAGFALPPPAQRCPNLFGARLPERFKGDFVGRLRERKVYIARRGSAVRFAPHLHVNEADLDQLFGALDEVVGR